MSEVAPLYDLEHLETIIVEHSRYRVSLNGCLLGEIIVEAIGEDRCWCAVGSPGHFASQAEAIAALVKHKPVAEREQLSGKAG